MKALLYLVESTLYMAFADIFLVILLFSEIYLYLHLRHFYLLIQIKVFKVFTLSAMINYLLATVAR